MSRLRIQYRHIPLLQSLLNEPSQRLPPPQPPLHIHPVPTLPTLALRTHLPHIPPKPLRLLIIYFQPPLQRPRFTFQTLPLNHINLLPFLFRCLISHCRIIFILVGG